MLNNSENISQNTEENQPNGWDMSDVADFAILEQPTERTEKTEEEREYEQRELGLKDELFEIAKRRAFTIGEAGDEFYDVMRRAEHPLAKRMRDSFDNLSQGKRMTDQAYLEGFFQYVDEMFPPAFSGRERDEKRIQEAEDMFQRSAIRESGIMEDNTNDIAKLFSMDGSEHDLQIATNIRNLGQSSADFPRDMAIAIIRYCSEPGKDRRLRINGIQADHERAVSNSLFNIADTFDKSRTEVGKHMFEPTMAFTSQITRKSEEYYEGLKDYIKFKMGASYDKYKIEDNPANHNPYEDAFL